MRTQGKATVSGVWEWASEKANCCKGCSHGCLYCYAREIYARQGWRAAADWTREEIRLDVIGRAVRPAKGTTMFPTTHDITPTNARACLEYLGKLLGSGRRVLIVSKPHREIVQMILDRFGLFRPQVLFRFTIGALSDTILGFWEPGAPRLSERVHCLRVACDAGWETSVSAEPLLEADRAAELVERLEPYVTDSIWIGKANDLRRRAGWILPKDHPEILRVLAGQTEAMVRDIYAQLQANPIVRWKESYKKVLGLDVAAERGADR